MGGEGGGGGGRLPVIDNLKRGGSYPNRDM